MSFEIDFSYASKADRKCLQSLAFVVCKVSRCQVRGAVELLDGNEASGKEGEMAAMFNLTLANPLLRLKMVFGLSSNRTEMTRTKM